MSAATRQISRPLRALAVLFGIWTAARVFLLWPTGDAAEPALVNEGGVVAVPSRIAAPLEKKMPFLPDRMPGAAFDIHKRGRQPELVSESIAATRPAARAGEWMRKQVQQDGRNDNIGPPAAVAPLLAKPGHFTAPGLLSQVGIKRFSGSAWVLMRSDGVRSLASGGQLGGSQIGMRLLYAPGPKALALTARVSAPLSQPTGREAALGVALRGRNIGLIAEQRIALDKGGRNKPAIFAYGGVYDVALPGALTLEGYAQAGVVGIKSPVTFVDGAIHIERAVVHGKHASLSVGVGAWGGAQPEAARIDVGPQIIARFAVADSSLRVAAEWRQRVAGDAVPASGPSVTVGFDF